MGDFFPWSGLIRAKLITTKLITTKLIS